MTEEVEVTLDSQSSENIPDLQFPVSRSSIGRKNRPSVCSSSRSSRNPSFMSSMKSTGSSRRSSLTPNELDLLNLIQKNDSFTSVERDCSARQSLRTSIASASTRGLLTHTETDFLTKLADVPTLSVEIVAKARDTLTGENLEELEIIMQSASQDSEEWREEQESRRSSINSRRSSVSSDGSLQLDASFRTELWAVQSESKLDTIVESNEGSMSSILSEMEDSLKTLFTGETEKSISEDLDKEFVILGTGPDDFDCQPHVMSPPIMEALRSHLPYVLREDNFWLKYSLMRDGSSMRCLLSKLRSSSRTVLAIETFEGDVFGAFVSSPWRPRGLKYFGSGEAFLWRMKRSRFTRCNSVEDQAKLESDVEGFPWSGENRNVQRLENPEARLIIGGGGPDDGSEGNEAEIGFGLMLSNNLEDGLSNPCLTFRSPSLSLSTDETFEIANMEVWTLTPVDTIDQAEKVELGRRFVFEQGNFLEE